MKFISDMFNDLSSRMAHFTYDVIKIADYYGIDRDDLLMMCLSTLNEAYHIGTFEQYEVKQK